MNRKATSIVLQRWTLNNWGSCAASRFTNNWRPENSTRGKAENSTSPSTRFPTTGRRLSDACEPVAVKAAPLMSARFESKRNRTFVYAQSPNAGLIELDEQPPLALDSDALDITLTVAALLSAKPVSLIQTMRKTVVDGRTPADFSEHR